MNAESIAGVTRLSFKDRLTRIFDALQGPVLAVLGAILVGGIVIAVSGFNPFGAYWAMLKGAFAGKELANLNATLNRAVPIIGMGLAAAIAFKSGYFNMGIEGQMVLGGFMAALASIYLPLQGPVLLIVSLGIAALIGGLYAALGMAIEYRFDVPLLISTLLLNYPARLLTSYLVNNQFRDVASGMSQTEFVPNSARFALLITGSQLNSGSFLILLLVIAAALMIYCTVPGYNLRMAGKNRRFAIYGGVDIKKLDYWVIFISGAVAGIVGAVLVLGVFYRFIDLALTTPNYAWVGLMAALLAGADPIGVVLAGLVFSAIQTGGYGMERETSIPREMSLFLQALIIMFIAVRGSFQIKRKTG